MMDNKYIDTTDEDLLEKLIIDEDIFDIESENKEQTEKSENKDTNIKTLTENECLNCESKNKLLIDEINGFIVCHSCGQVNNLVYDVSPEWRSYTESGKTEVARCSSVNLFYPKSSVGTSISGKWMSKIHRLHEWDKMVYREKRLWLVHNKIKDICRRAGINKKIEEDAIIMYKNISECRHKFGKNKGNYIIVRGIKRKSLIAACLYNACLRNNDTRDGHDIVELFEIDATDLTKGNKMFMELMNLKEMPINVDVVHPEHYIPRYCRQLRIKGDFVQEAVQIATGIRKLNIASTHTPISIAIASILLMINNHKLGITKKLMAEKLNISEVTISKTYSHIYKLKNVLINKELLTKVIEQHKIMSQTQGLPPALQKEYEKMENHYQKFTKLKTIKETKIEQTKDANTEMKELKEYCDNTLIKLKNNFEKVNRMYNSIIK